MNLVETCRANQVIPFEYMMAVVKNAPAAKMDPGRWMPWNFQATLPEKAAQAPGVAPAPAPLPFNQDRNSNPSPPPRLRGLAEGTQ